MEVLQKLRIKYVVNATAQLKNFHEGSLSYIKINEKDKEGVDLSPYFDQVTDFIAAGLATGSGVLVHCVAGASRSVTFVLAYLMCPKGERLCLKDAFDFVKARRRCVCSFFALGLSRSPINPILFPASYTVKHNPDPLHPNSPQLCPPEYVVPPAARTV